MKRILPGACLAVLVNAALLGCVVVSTKVTTEYPSAWAPRVEAGVGSTCMDISGVYHARSEPAPAPTVAPGHERQDYFIFPVPPIPIPLPSNHPLPAVTGATRLLFPCLLGITRDDADWFRVAQLVDWLENGGNDAEVTIRQPDANHIEVVATAGAEVLMQETLSRGDQPWFSLKHAPHLFQCDSGTVSTDGVIIADAAEYFMSRRGVFPDPGPYPPRSGRKEGVAGAYFHFFKSTDGSLVMQESQYFCGGACRFMGYRTWWQWKPVREAQVR